MLALLCFAVVVLADLVCLCVFSLLSYSLDHSQLARIDNLRGAILTGCDLKGCEMTEGGAAVLLDLVKRHKTLTSIDLRDNQNMGLDATKAFVALLQGGQSKLLSVCGIMLQEAVTYLHIKTLTSSSTITTIPSQVGEEALAPATGP